MNNQFQENKGMFLLLLSLLFVLLIVCYFIFLQPVQSDKKTKESQLQQGNNDIALLEIQINNERNKDDGFNNMDKFKLAGQLPEDPFIDQLILTLEEIEFVSGSRFEQIQFSYGGSTPERYLGNEEELGGELEENSNEQNDTHDLVEEQEEQAPPFDFEGKPEELQVINISMKVLSTNYDHFQSFIQEIEKQERMMFVSHLNFNHPGEEQLLIEDPPIEEITFDVTLTTFYYVD